MTNFVHRLVAAQQVPVLGRLAKEILAVYGVEFPKSIKFGSRLNLVHRGFGVVLTPNTKLGTNVTIYHGVTIARSDSWVPLDGRTFPGVEIGDHAVLCPGAKILAPVGELLSVGAGTVIAANSVLTQSTGEWEVWAGTPARKISERLDRAGVE
jgi:serine O-acetyltransferase